MEKIKRKLRLHKEIFLSNYKKDKFGTLLLYISYGLLFVDLATLYSFTSRENFNFITNAISIAFSVFALLYLFCRGKFYINGFVCATFLLVLYALIYSIFTRVSVKSVLTIYGFLIVVVLFFMNTKKYRFLIFCYLVGTIVFAFCFYVFSFKDFLDGNFTRMGSELANVNAVARGLGFGMAIQTSIAIKKKKWFFLLLFPAILSLVAIVFTGSRFGLITSIVALAISVYINFVKKHKILYLCVCLALVFAAILLFNLPFMEEYKKHFLKLFIIFGVEDGSVDSSLFSRLNMFFDGIRLWQKNLIFGYGYEGFAKNTGYGVFSHSSVSEILCDFGLFGIFLMVLPFILILVRTIKSKDRYNVKYIFTTIILMVLLTSIASVVTTDKYALLPYFMIVPIDFLENKNKSNYLVISFYENKKINFYFKYIKKDSYINFLEAEI